MTGLRGNRRTVVLAACCVLAGIGVVIALLWPVTDLIAAHDVGVITGPARAAALQTAREAARTQLLTLGAGLFAAGALFYTARNFTLSRQQFEQSRQQFTAQLELSRKAAQDSAEAERRTLELTERGQVTDRYTKAIEQLGSDKLDVRIGGIYALERIARDSASDHPTVIEVLTTFIREHSREQWPPSEPDSETPERATRPDVQAALTVIGRRNTERDVRKCDLRNAILIRADLTGSDLTDADIYRADLTRANLTGANLSRADLWLTVLTEAVLLRATLADAFLGRADLAGARLSDANLTEANFADANLSNADLIRADLTNANLAGANLTDANLDEASWPESLPAPDGWVRDAAAGKLKRAPS
jgi:uncharacterized protein YjbI with pentapeptide repeats